MSIAYTCILFGATPRQQQQRVCARGIWASSYCLDFLCKPKRRRKSEKKKHSNSNHSIKTHKFKKNRELNWHNSMRTKWFVLWCVMCVCECECDVQREKPWNMERYNSVERQEEEEKTTTTSAKNKNPNQTTCSLWIFLTSFPLLYIWLRIALETSKEMCTQSTQTEPQPLLNGNGEQYKSLTYDLNKKKTNEFVWKVQSERKIILVLTHTRSVWPFEILNTAQTPFGYVDRKLSF